MGAAEVEAAMVVRAEADCGAIGAAAGVDVMTGAAKGCDSTFAAEGDVTGAEVPCSSDSSVCGDAEETASGSCATVVDAPASRMGSRTTSLYDGGLLVVSSAGGVMTDGDVCLDVVGSSRGLRVDGGESWASKCSSSDESDEVASASVKSGMDEPQDDTSEIREGMESVSETTDDAVRRRGRLKSEAAVVDGAGDPEAA